MANAPARLNLRIDARDKDRIARAAALCGMAVSAFVRSAVLREAEMALAAETNVVLPQAEARHFLAVLDAPFQPNGRLKNAIERAAQVSARR